MTGDELATRARRELLDREKRDAVLTIREFGKIRDNISAELDAVLKAIADARAIGNVPTPGLIFEGNRLKRLLDAVTDEINRAAGPLTDTLTDAQEKALSIARSQARGLPQLAADLQLFDAEATRELIGISGDGGPLARLFKKLAKPIRQSIFDALINGMAQGATNQQIAAVINRSVGNGAAAAMTIARTETNRAYREASRKFYDDVPAVIGWRWLSALDLNTCPLCWAMHGRIFKTKVKMGTHPNCRCTMVPVFATDAAANLGTDLFAKLNQAQQTAILGPKRFELYSAGVKLPKFVGTKKTPFGPGRFLIAARDITPPTNHE